MLRTTTHIAMLVLVAFGSSCNKRTAVFSDRDLGTTETGRGDDAEGTKPPGEVTVEPIAAPSKWPKCWLSFRLSTATSFHLAGARHDTWVTATYQESDGRQELKGTAKNPAVEGDCVLNWFAQDHSQEPWVALFKQEFPRYQAVVTCTTPSTPDCSCGSTLPIETDGYVISKERCIRKTSAGKGYELYYVREPNTAQALSNEGHCDAALSAVENIARINITRHDFQAQTQDIQETGGAGQTCRTDFEPFAPLSDEKDWYASSIRDWALTSCQDQTTGCRCYAFYSKSSHVDSARSNMFDTDTCLLCKDGTCQLVKM